MSDSAIALRRDVSSLRFCRVFLSYNSSSKFKSDSVAATHCEKIDKIRCRFRLFDLLRIFIRFSLWNHNTHKEIRKELLLSDLNGHLLTPKYQCNCQYPSCSWHTVGSISPKFCMSFDEWTLYWILPWYISEKDVWHFVLIMSVKKVNVERRH